MVTTPDVEIVASTLTVLFIPRQVTSAAWLLQVVLTEERAVYVVLEVTAPVRVPRVPDVMVTLLPLSVVMTPVKSSMVSSVPAAWPVLGRDETVMILG